MSLTNLQNRRNEVEVEIEALNDQSTPERKAALYAELKLLNEQIALHNSKHPFEDVQQGIT